MNFNFGPPSNTMGTAPPPSAGSGSAFSFTPSAPFSSSSMTANTATNNSQQPVATLASHPFQYMQQSYDPAHPGYRFRAIFYNSLLDDGPNNTSRPNVQKPANVPERLWQQAVADNPDPSRMVPVIAHGPKDLQLRADSQREHWSAYQAKASEIRQRLATIEATMSAPSGPLERLRGRQATLLARMLVVEGRLEALRRRGQPLNVTELKAHGDLQALTRAVAQHLADLPGLLEQLRMLSDSSTTRSSIQGGKLITDTKLTADSTDTVEAILGEQSRQLATVLDTIATCQRDVDTMQGGYAL